MFGFTGAARGSRDATAADAELTEGGRGQKCPKLDTLQPHIGADDLRAATSISAIARSRHSATRRRSRPRSAMAATSEAWTLACWVSAIATVSRHLAPRLGCVDLVDYPNLDTLDHGEAVGLGLVGGLCNLA